MITDNKYEPSFERLHLPVDEKILSFLDYIVLMLSQASSVEEIDMIMDDFISDDVMKIMSDNRQLFSILSVIWLEAFERVCLNDRENNFSLNILHLPVIFKKLNWHIEDREKLARIQESCLEKSEESTKLYPNLILLFAEGLIYSTEKALTNFENRVEGLINTTEDEIGITQLIRDIISLGWRSE